MPENKERIKTEEKEFNKRISEISETKDTGLRRSLLNVALRQNDLIYSLQKRELKG